MFWLNKPCTCPSLPIFPIQKIWNSGQTLWNRSISQTEDFDQTRLVVNTWKGVIAWCTASAVEWSAGSDTHVLSPHGNAFPAAAAQPGFSFAKNTLRHICCHCFPTANNLRVHNFPLSTVSCVFSVKWKHRIYILCGAIKAVFSQWRINLGNVVNKGSYNSSDHLPQMAGICIVLPLFGFLVYCSLTSWQRNASNLVSSTCTCLFLPKIWKDFLILYA